MSGEVPNHQRSTVETGDSAPSHNALWVLTEVYYPEDISTGYYLTTIAEGLARDRMVKVITGQPKHMSRGVKAPAHEVRNRVEIFRASGTTFDKNVFALRLINMLTIGLSVFVKSLRHFRRGDHVLVVTAPPSLPVTTTLACLLKGASFTLLVQDSYPEILVAVGSAKPDSLFVKIVHFFNQWVYKHTSGIIVMGRDMSELFMRKTVGLDVPVITIPNWADLNTVIPGPRNSNELLAKLGLTDKFVLLYAGNIGHPTDVETIIECAERLADRDEIHFIFIGEGVKKKWLEARVHRSSLKNVTILGYRPWNEQSQFLNACDIGLVALVRGMWGTAMPSRTYNIMAAGRPIIALADRGSELSMVVEEERIGWQLEPGDPDKLLRVILEAYERRAELPGMGERARLAAAGKYSPEVAIQAYANALDRVALLNNLTEIGRI